MINKSVWKSVLKGHNSVKSAVNCHNSGNGLELSTVV